MASVLALGRALVALVLALGLAAPGLDTCLCDVFSGGAERCCDETRAQRADAGQAELDEGPCCCCSLDVLAAPAPAPTVVQRESNAPDGERRTASALAASFASVELAIAAGQGLRPRGGPDPTPPFARLHRRTVVLLI